MRGYTLTTWDTAPGLGKQRKNRKNLIETKVCCRSSVVVAASILDFHPFVVRNSCSVRNLIFV